MKTINKIKSFEIKESLIQFWILKGEKLNAKIVKTSINLESNLKQVKINCLNGLNSSVSYDAASTFPEDSIGFITGPIEQWNYLKNKIDAQLSPIYINDVKELNNSEFYIVKFTNKQGKILYACKKCGKEWKATKSKDSLAVYLKGDTLENVSDFVFTISQTFDFLVLDDDFFILNKKKFESILKYKIEHQRNFEALIKEEEFIKNFDGIDCLMNYIGSNSIQLGRMSSALKQKHYADPIYMQRIRDENINGNWGINLKDNKFVFTESSTRTLILILLGHRVKSICGRKTMDASGLTPIS